MFIKFKFDRIIYIWVKKRGKMLSKEVAIQVIQILGIVGFIILIFFILIAKYVKDPSERKIFIYSFIALSFFLVIWTTISMTPPKPDVFKKEVATTNNNVNTSQVIKNGSSIDSNNSNVKVTKEVSSQTISNGISYRSNNVNSN